ncbi:hypothetical protein [Bradyrhizobium japonicum]
MCIGRATLDRLADTFLTNPMAATEVGAPIVSMYMLTPMPLTASSKRTNQAALAAAFAMSDLRSICRAVDAAVVAGGIAKVARAAKVDRTTVYCAFRCESGPALDTMVRVLRVLGLRLIVKIEPYLPGGISAGPEDDGSVARGGIQRRRFGPGHRSVGASRTLS